VWGRKPGQPGLFYFYFIGGVFMKKLWVLMCALVLAVGLLAAGCGGGDKKDAGAAAKPAKKELLVGTEPSFAPFEFPKEKL
jgi:ABC-type amino acid transport substrate-binding protein